MQATACTDQSRPSPPALCLPRDRNEKEEARSRCALHLGGDEPRYRVGIANAQAFPVGAESERALMRAVLVDAIRCLAGEVSPLTERVRLASQARTWVRSQDEEWPFSFENVCAALDLQTARLRTLLLSPPAVLRRVSGFLVARLAP